jgi:hypothetical protein
MEVTIDGVRYVPVTGSVVALTVLVPSVSTRRATFAPKIAESLFGQHERLVPELGERVEILIVTDTGRSGGMLIGDKRNAMLRMARGEYVVFVDDDDRVADDYLSTLLAATSTGDDCITFDCSVSLNGAPPRTCHYDLKYERDANVGEHYERLPNHITAVKRMLALSCGFPSKQCGEDSDYAARLRPMLRTQHRIPRTLYFYDSNSATTETQGRAVATSPIVDVVILSKAASTELRAMCQDAIDTCIAGAGRGQVNIIVVEQIEGTKYNGANEILYAPGNFNYNKFANRGATAGKAPWIMVANSDLQFAGGWLEALLAANRDCVSPVDPTHTTQRNVRHNEAGWQNGHHFSGWCFMVRRTLWQSINGFDDCVSYWCSDDVVIEQCRQVGVMPMVVAAARVRHLGSRTLRVPSDDESWGQVMIFNQKYKKDRFSNDSRFRAFLRKKGALA